MTVISNPASPRTEIYLSHPCRTHLRHGIRSDLRLTSPAPFSSHFRKEKNFAELSSQGHFLKGSSATLGITKVKDSCEKIQHLGARKDESGNPSNESDAYFLAKIEQIIKQVRVDYKQAEVVLKKFYEALGK